MSDTDRIAALEARLAEAERRLTVQEDEQAVRKLHHLYGYLIDKCLYNETVDLFTDDCEVHFFGGIYRGKAGAARLYIERFQANFTHGNNGPIDGFLLDHPQHQDVVDIEADGVTALGRFRCTMTAGRHKDFGEPRQWFEGGIYENVYKKIDGVWRIHILNYVPQWHADFETGWAHTRPNYVPFLDTTWPEDPTGPDELKSDVWLWPTHKVVPFHNAHPVTGEPIRPERWQGDIDRENASARETEAAVTG
ncbi:MAG: nuclear transport factor 2 family protein [Sphingomonadaceae bacterium]|nr:nuclear transport factor 2 family protein [Sphingomonadaceae bacterium]